MNAKTGGQKTSKMEGVNVSSPDASAAAVATSKWVYFYYLKNTNDPWQRERAFALKRPAVINLNNIKREIQAIVSEIKSDAHEPHGLSIGAIPWRRKSFMVFILDDEDHEVTDVTLSPDHSFTNIEPFGKFDNITGYYCFNHIRDRNHDPLEGPESIDVKVIHPHDAVEVKLPFFDHQDTGTNLGPPVGGGG